MTDTVVLVEVVGTVTGVETGDPIGDETTGELTGVRTGAVSAIGDDEGENVGSTVGALVGTNTKGACTTASGMVAARLVDMALTVAGLAKRASMDDVLPADAAVTMLYATWTPTTVACNNSLLLDAVTVPSDQNSFTEVMVTVLPVGNTDMIDAVKAIWNAGVLAVTPMIVCRTKTGRFVGCDVGCCNKIESKG